MGSVLFTVIITPIIQILEFFFTLFFEITKSQGLSVIGLSFVVTLCTLPLYMVAEKWEATERDIQTAMKPTISRIKSVFKGDEQYMILTTYYRQNRYHPLMALRSSFSLLIQIPFFISAYTFLSHLETLKGASFLFVRNFGAPDSLFKIGNFSINVLPIAMTLINCTSGLIYSKGHGAREKIQIFACAAVFLVLLYNSPAGLVIYWTMNNILSLVKNIFYKLKNAKKIMFLGLFAVSALLLLADLLVFKKTKFAFRAALALGAVILPALPYILRLWNTMLDKIFPEEKKIPSAVFYASAILLAVMAGLGIPSILMESEPEQYCYVEGIASPFVFLRHTFYQAIGFFVLWPLCFYNLFSARTKKGFVLVYGTAAVLALVNTFIFSENYGPILPELIFMTPQKFEPSRLMVAANALAMAAGIAAVVTLLKFKAKLLSSVCTIVIISLAAVSFRNINSINREYRKMTPPAVQDHITTSYHLSKTGKNVILIMQDRLINNYSMDILDSNPELREKFSGFEFYTNVVSMGRYTMIGTPGLFGGYDYTPWEMIQRKDEPLQKKHNEALLTLPRLFHAEGFDVTVSGLPYENYLEYPITDMYRDDQYVVRAETRGLYSDYWYKEEDFPKAEYLEHDIKRNFIWFSIFKMVSPILRRTVYHEGYWTSYDRYNDGIARYIDNYSELEYLPEMTDSESTSDSFIMIDNELVHESIDLPLPDYDPVRLKNKDNVFDKKHDDHYTTMISTFRKLGDFMQHLKDLGVYDNTRIIIVSDHGKGGHDGFLDENLPGLNKQNFVCTLMVKDFAGAGDMKFNSEFMTNADTPWLCTQGIIPQEKQVNPFTGNPLKRENKADYVKLLGAQAESTRIRKESSWHVKDSEWYTVKDDIYSNENWKQLFN
ncbi:MAG: YidC/Oxa1 family membrane protein insertase [Treponema sp.]|nr:YidC/Oxa1 family membrane protein insertase [Treponema sp.]